jgi:hypothetical protein
MATTLPLCGCRAKRLTCGWWTNSQGMPPATAAAYFAVDGSHELLSSSHNCYVEHALVLSAVAFVPSSESEPCRQHQRPGCSASRAIRSYHCGSVAVSACLPERSQYTLRTCAEFAVGRLTTRRSHRCAERHPKKTEAKVRVQRLCQKSPRRSGP